uniref:Uncharacterized protein n=1 Tax=Arundo donax TaxID=35708 RepID=A0A0A8Y5G8_ARUDO
MGDSGTQGRISFRSSLQLAGQGVVYSIAGCISTAPRLTSKDTEPTTICCCHRTSLHDTLRAAGQENACGLSRSCIWKKVHAAL